MFIFTVWLLLSKEDEARALGLELKSCPCGKHCLERLLRTKLAYICL